jgi:hypothetical protein
MEKNDENRWVVERLSALDPDWQADFARGKRLLDAGLGRQTRPWFRMAAAAAVAGICIAAVAFPQTRALAQQLWSHFILNRVDVVRVDFSDLPLHAQVTAGGPPQAVQDLDDAARKAGFQPYLPAPGVLPANPSMVVLRAMEAEQTIHVADFQAALNKVGAKDVQVPPEWEGVQLRARIGPIVNLGYADDVGILEAKPIELSIPAGFPLQRFAEVAFRSLRVSEREARALAQRFVANPAWLLDIPSDEVANVEQVSLRAGPALLVEEINDDGTAGRVTILRSSSERIYCVLANNRQVALRTADALP